MTIDPGFFDSSAEGLELSAKAVLSSPSTSMRIFNRHGQGINLWENRVVFSRYFCYTLFIQRQHFGKKIEGLCRNNISYGIARGVISMAFFRTTADILCLYNACNGRFFVYEEGNQATKSQAMLAIRTK